VKAEFVNAFLDPALNIWKKELGTYLAFDHAEGAKGGAFTTEDMTAIIGVTRQLKGNVFYEFTQETALAVASAMCGEQFTEMTELGLSALGELANMIIGNATIALSAADYVCDISPPVILARGASVTVVDPQIRAYFTSPLGGMSIRVGLSEVKD
jgi:chemotaxis protein CheX